MPSREFVLSFREAAPYIHAYRGKTFVLAINGEVLQSGEFSRLAQDINLLVSLGVRIVLIHGIRPQIESLLSQQHIPAQHHRRRRVTDANTMEIVKQVAGATRCDIEATLSMGMPNSPMHGAHLRVASGNFVTARPLGVLDGVDMQYTGQVRRIDSQAIRSRLDQGELVLLSPLGYSLTGEAFNLAMEELACQVAIALKAEKLSFMIEECGVVLAQKLISTLTSQQAEELLAAGKLSADVSAYLPYAIRATREGVARAHLISRHKDGALLLEHFTQGGNGTMIARDPLVRVRTATVEDIADILGLIQPLEEQGTLVKRNREHLEVEISHYAVLEHDDQIAGCVAMHSFRDEATAELACLAVSPHRRDAGFGEILLQHVEYQARAQGLLSLFVLTTQTSHWFVERGFVETDKNALPLARQQLYNEQRRSKVLLKTL
ncbi:amino-acid N-acetyltransferase [Neisseriaceae bacterium TC5R-5]|nr:amino-acid N-acetyltransferase [Neisseriaceae bacterium TC5R-5]